MIARRAVRAVATVATAIAAYLYCPETRIDAFGVAPAEAKAFYTRKRVKGRWVTGRFAKQTSRPSVRTQKVAASPLPDPEPRPAAVENRLVESGGQHSVPPTAVAVPPPKIAPLSDDERLLKLQEALKVRASKLAEGADQPRTVSAGSIAPAPMRSPKSVTFDFETGLKSITLADGTRAEERFDPTLEQRVPPRAR